MASTDAATPAAPAILRTEVLAEESDGGGLKKEVLAEGSGDFPPDGFEVVAHYTGRLLDGTIFDSSVGRGQPFKFVIGKGQVIKGWDRGFATMRKGEKAFLTCGPGYAYGAAGSPPAIPPNATLVFEVELLGYNAKKKQAYEMNAREKLAAAEESKAEGNRAFTSGDVITAWSCYDEGWRVIEWVTPESDYENPFTEEEKAALKALKVTLKTNAAMCHVKRKAWPEAAKDATEALKHDAHNAKALFRRGTARAHMGLLEEAKADLAAALAAAPADAGIKAELERVRGLEKAAREREKKAFGGLFKKKGFTLSEDTAKAEAEAASVNAALESAAREGEAAAALADSLKEGDKKEAEQAAPAAEATA